MAAGEVFINRIRAVNLLKIQLEVQILCTPSLFPKLSNRLDWCLFFGVILALGPYVWHFSRRSGDFPKSLPAQSQYQSLRAEPLQSLMSVCADV